MKKLQLNVTTLLFLFSITIFGLSSCASPQKLIEEGNYDKALEVAIKKLAGKKNKKAKHVMALEEAFAKITAADLRKADRLRAEGRPENWERIYDIYAQIRRRQEMIEPLLPLVDEDGVQAEFRFVRTDELEIESKKNAAEYFYNDAKKLIALGQAGDKRAARRAFDQLGRINRFYRDYKDKDQLMGMAHELGTTHILFRMKNNAPVVLPSDFERAILSMNVRDLESHWQVYHTTKKPELDYDYNVIMNITNIEVTPSLVKEREYREEKEIKDGFEYILDENGNVMKDSLGNDIKVDRYVEIQAWVLETFQQKMANVSGQLEFYDTRTNELIDRKTLVADAIFENYASTFEGDRRALSRESKRRIGNRPLPFPTNEALLYDAAQSLKPIIKEKLSRTRLL
jgi:hypothetical protein